MSKGPEAFRTISEVATALDLPQHVLRFWETRFKQIKPMKRGGGRRYYRPQDVALLRGIRHLLYGEGYTIKGVQRILKEEGVQYVAEAGVAGVREASQEALPPPETPEETEERRRSKKRVRKAPARPVAKQPDEQRKAPAQNEPVASPVPAQTALSGEDVEHLKAALAELVELKRLLDETR